MPTPSQKKPQLTKKPLLKSRWYNGCETASAKLELEQRVLEQEDLLLILATVIEQKLQANSRLRREKAAYDKPAFSEFQADCNGYERGLEELLSYLKITKET